VHLILGNGILAGIVLSISALKSWYGGVRKTHEIALRARRMAGGIFAEIQQPDGGGKAIAALCAMLLLISQGLWLAINYLIGNLVAGITNVNRGLSQLNVDRVPPWGQFIHALEWDRISTGYILLSLVGLTVSYVYAARRRSPDFLIFLFALPGYIYGFCGLAGGALMLIGNIIGHATHHGLYQPWPVVIFVFCAGIIGSLYAIGTRNLFRAPLAIRELWFTTIQTLA
jgi:hypothetical protein